MFASSECVGYVASGLVLLTFTTKSMRPLRSLAILSNLAFIAYGVLDDIIPVVALHLILLPLNIFRLMQLRPEPMRAPACLAPAPDEQLLLRIGGPGVTVHGIEPLEGGRWAVTLDVEGRGVHHILNLSIGVEERLAPVGIYEDETAAAPADPSPSSRRDDGGAAVAGQGGLVMINAARCLAVLCCLGWLVPAAHGQAVSAAGPNGPASVPYVAKGRLACGSRRVCTIAFAPVPAGHRLAIERIAIAAEIVGGTFVRAAIVAQPAGDVVSSAGFAVLGRDALVVSERAAPSFVEVGSYSAVLTSDGFFSPINPAVFLTISGRLLDCAASGCATPDKKAAADTASAQ